MYYCDIAKNKFYWRIDRHYHFVRFHLQCDQHLETSLQIKYQSGPILRHFIRNKTTSRKSSIFLLAKRVLHSGSVVAKAMAGQAEVTRPRYSEIVSK